VTQIEAFGLVRDFIETGGQVLLVIGLVTGIMWALIVERFLFFNLRFPRERKAALEVWDRRRDHSSWNAQAIRRKLISRLQLQLRGSLRLIQTLVAICPMLGLLGTVTGMIEVFDVMAVAGSGNARGMAAGVSKATLPTMAGMVSALSGMLFSIHLERFAKDETERVADGLELYDRRETADAT